MTDNDLKIRARIAYGMQKQAVEGLPDEETQKKLVEKSYHDAVTRGAALSNATKAKETADARDQQMLDALDYGNRVQAFEDAAKHHSEVNNATEGPLKAERDRLDTINQLAPSHVSDSGADYRRNLAYGIGSGALGGAAVGGLSYALGGLFPSLRKRRLLRALLALGIGTGAGVGIGYGVNAGLTSGKLQGALADAGRKASGAWDATKSGVANAIGKLKG